MRSIRRMLMAAQRSSAGNGCGAKRRNRVLEPWMHGFGDVNRPRMGWSAARPRDDADAPRVRVPGLHCGALVGCGEVGEHDVARVDVEQVAFDDLGLVA